MSTITYNHELSTQLQIIRNTAEQFTSEDITKSAAQMIAEIDVIKNMLDQVKILLENNSDTIL